MCHATTAGQKSSKPAYTNYPALLEPNFELSFGSTYTSWNGASHELCNIFS